MHEIRRAPLFRGLGEKPAGEKFATVPHAVLNPAEAHRAGSRSAVEKALYCFITLKQFDFETPPPALSGETRFRLRGGRHIPAAGALCNFICKML
jgi:hypothetical protein